jgi:hypothetical protein
MSLRKNCSPDALQDDGTRNRMRCLTSPQCDHHWHYDFRAKGRRYRASTWTADKSQARDIEAKERTRIRRGPDPTRTLREMAIVWAEQVRIAIEACKPTQ